MFRLVGVPIDRYLGILAELTASAGGGWERGSRCLS